MKWQLFLALGGTLQAVAGLELIGKPEIEDGVICYTYLTTYLAPVDAQTVGSDIPTAPSFPTTRGILPPIFTNRSTSVPQFTFPSIPWSSDVVQAPTTVTLTEASTTSSEPDATGQAVILFVAPTTDDESRSLVKRAPGSFIGGSNVVQICTNAASFILAEGQLLYNGDPVYYNGDPYTEFGGQGAPPVGAITREFGIVRGTLVFASRSLPGTNAGFCQQESGQVYLTFGSSPPGCDPVSIRVFADGRIIGLDTTSTTEPNQSSMIAGPMVTGSTETITFPDVSYSTTLAGSSQSTGLSQSSGASTETTEKAQSFDDTESSTTDIATMAISGSFSMDSPSAEASITSQSFISFSSSSTTTASSSSFSSFTAQSTDLSSSFVTLSSTVSTFTSISTQLPSSFSSIDSTSSIDTFSSEPTSTLPTALSTESGTTSEESATTSVESTTTTSVESTATTEEPATTTTGPCNSVDPLTTVALANPTPVFNDDASHDNSFASIVLPWGDVGLVGSGQNTVFISSNGVISLDAGNTNSENTELPTDSLVNRAFLPYWDDLVLDRSKGHTIVYEIFDGRFGVELVVEFILGKVGSSTDVYHFEANFLRDSPAALRFQYYTTPEKGSSATAGFQTLDNGRFTQVSYNQANVLLDATSINIPINAPNTVLSSPFDNTECGKGQDLML